MGPQPPAPHPSKLGAPRELTTGAILAPMKRMNLRDVPDDVYATLAGAAESNRQSLNAFVVERLAEIAQVVNVAAYLDSYEPPRGTRITAEDAVTAVREVRETS